MVSRTWSQGECAGVHAPGGASRELKLSILTWRDADDDFDLVMSNPPYVPAPGVRRSRSHGPVITRRLPWLRAQGLIGADEDSEELVIIRAERS